MATVITPAAMPPAGKNNRGKDQIAWSDGVWKALDHAVMEEMRRTRVAAKFLPHVHVEKKQTNVAADVVISPVQAALVTGQTPPADSALFVDESLTNRIQEYWVTFRMSVAQVEEEEHAETAMGPAPATAHQGKSATATHQTTYSQRASTGVSLAMRTANILAQAEDLILLNGQNAVANSPLFKSQVVQALDVHLQKDLDLGLLNIEPFPISGGGTTPVIALPPSQVIPVHPVPPIAGVSLRYAENTLDAIALGFSILQGLGHYENYALVLHTFPYADLHQPLPNTLIEPIEPLSHLIKAGIFGTGTLPPFDGAGAGVPTQIFDAKGNPESLTNVTNGTGISSDQKVLYTGVLVSLSGNTMDHVRGSMDDQLDVMVTFNQKDSNEQYRFRVVERFCLRLKDPSAVILLLFMDK